MNIIYFLVGVLLQLFGISGEETNVEAVVKYNRPAPEERGSKYCTYWVKLVGVTFEGRQDAIKALRKGSTLTYKLVEGHVGTDGVSYPNAVGVYAYTKDCGWPDNRVMTALGESVVLLGWIPDAPKSTMAKMFRDKIRKDKAPEIIEWALRPGTHATGLHIRVRNLK